MRRNSLWKNRRNRVFYIVSETSIASGVRRIEAVTGKNADDYAKKSFSIVKKLSNELNTKPEEISEKIYFLNQTIKNLRKELSSSSNSIEIIEKIISSASKINGYDTIFNNIENLDPKKLRDTSELLKKKYEGITILASVFQEKINLVISVPKIYSDKFNANQMVKSLSKIIGGGGGGNPLTAQGGGTENNSYDKISKSLTEYIENG